MKNLPYIFLGLFLMAVSHSFGQGKQIQIVNSNTFEQIERNGGKIKKLIGDVHLKQNTTQLYCDSAYLFDETNFVESYGHVRINHQDSVTFYGDFLRYDGNNRTAVLQQNVSMVDQSAVLTSNELLFDMAKNKVSYSSGAKLVSDESVLTSKYGYYFINSKELFFSKQVKLVNPEFELKGDTLKYNTKTKTATFLGKSIITSSTDTIYSTNGTYNTEKQSGVLLNRSKVRSKENTLIADTIFYNKKLSYSKALGNIVITDTINQSVILGNVAELFGKENRSYVTNEALVMTVMDGDTVLIWADTIMTFKRSAQQKRDIVKAYAHVRIYKQDIQAICDSLVYIKQDSTMILYHAPVLWSGVNQITGDTIVFYINDRKLDSMYVNNNAFVISKENAKHYNQIRGKNIKGFFKQGKIDFIFVYGNGQSIYYAKEDNAYIGVNVIDCSEMKFKFMKGKIETARFITTPTANFYPIEQLKPEELRLKGFKWHEANRPQRNLMYKKKPAQTL